MLFGAEIYYEHREWFLTNYIKSICPDEKNRVCDFNGVLDRLAKKEEYDTTVGLFLQLCNQRKKTESFVSRKFSEISNSGGEIVHFNGRKVSQEEFKSLDNEARIIIRPKGKEETHEISATTES